MESYFVDVRIMLLKGHPVWGPTLYMGSSGSKRGTLRGVLLCGWTGQTLKGAPWVGYYSVGRRVCLKGAPWVGSFSVDKCVRLLNLTLDGFLVCRLELQALKGAPWVSVLHCR